MRVERFSLFFPPLIARKKVGETEYAIGVDPARGLREDHRDEPGRGPPGRGPHPRLLLAAGVEADRGDRRRAGGEPGARVRAAVRVLLADRAADGHDARSARSRRATPPPGVLKPGDRLVAVDGARRHARRALASGSPRTSAPQEPPTKGCKAADAGRRSRSSATASARRSTLTPIYDPQAERTRLGFAYAPRPARPAAARRGASTDRSTAFWFITARRSSCPRGCSTPRSARRSPASSAPTRSRARRSSATSPTSSGSWRSSRSRWRS